jgi:hypothetical protein
LLKSSLNIKIALGIGAVVIKWLTSLLIIYWPISLKIC